MEVHFEAVTPGISMLGIDEKVLGAVLQVEWWCKNRIDL